MPIYNFDERKSHHILNERDLQKVLNCSLYLKNCLRTPSFRVMSSTPNIAYSELLIFNLSACHTGCRLERVHNPSNLHFSTKRVPINQILEMKNIYRAHYRNLLSYHFHSVFYVPNLKHTLGKYNTPSLSVIALGGSVFSCFRQFFIIVLIASLLLANT